MWDQADLCSSVGGHDLAWTPCTPRSGALVLTVHREDSRTHTVGMSQAGEGVGGRDGLKD